MVVSQEEKTAGDAVLQIVAYVFCIVFALIGRFYYNMVQHAGKCVASYHTKLICLQGYVKIGRLCSILAIVFGIAFVLVGAVLIWYIIAIQ